MTDREREVFLLLAAGRSNQEIASELYLSEGTIKVHVGHILAKLELRDRVQAVVLPTKPVWSCRVRTSCADVGR